MSKGISNLKQPKIRDKAHRQWISQLPCLITGSREVQTAHIRAKGNAGVGLKSSDSRCVPLSCGTHAEQHHIGEQPFWEQFGGVDKAIRLAEDLYKVSGDNMAAFELITRWRVERAWRD